MNRSPSTSSYLLLLSCIGFCRLLISRQRLKKRPAEEASSPPCRTVCTLVPVLRPRAHFGAPGCPHLSLWSTQLVTQQRLNPARRTPGETVSTLSAFCWIKAILSFVCVDLQWSSGPGRAHWSSAPPLPPSQCLTQQALFMHDDLVGFQDSLTLCVEQPPGPQCGS